MGHYAKLGTLAVRWMGVGFFVLALVFLPFGVTGGEMMQGSGGGMGFTMGAMWWGPMVLNVVMGLLLFALSRPIGSAMASGLDT